VSLLDRLPSRQPYVCATTDRELIVNRPYRTTCTLPEPEPEPTDDELECICTPFGAVGQNPTCDVHPWWRHDTAVLDLADLTRELGSAWEAARQHADRLNREAE
jgi:hypothetical protein